MILGIGIDLCRIDRIRRSLDRFGDAWIEEVFTPQERAWGLSVSDPGMSFARAFCCKEACAKALGTGFGAKVDPREIELSPAMSVQLYGTPSARLTRMTPAAHRSEFLVSISNTDQFASSIVLLQAIP